MATKKRKTPTPRYLAALMIVETLQSLETSTDSSRISSLEEKADTTINPKKFGLILDQYLKLVGKVRNRCHTIVTVFEKPTEATESGG